MPTYLGVVLVDAISNKDVVTITSSSLEVTEHSVMPVDLFSKHFLQIDNATTVSASDLDRFLGKAWISSKQHDSKTIVSTFSVLEDFNFYETSSCVDFTKYDEVVGQQNCVKKVRNKLWEFLGFVLAWGKGGFVSTKSFQYNNAFSWAMEELKKGKSVSRKKWNNKQYLFIGKDKQILCSSVLGYNVRYLLSAEDYSTQDWGYYCLDKGECCG